jgi:hypothetical protein
VAAQSEKLPLCVWQKVDVVTWGALAPEDVPVPLQLCSPEAATALCRHEPEMALVLAASHVVPAGHATSQLPPSGDG